jgi:hypothetical protein
MTNVFVIRNQLGHYWGKSKAWLDGSDPRALLRTKHEDEAVNTLFELSAKDIELRGEVLPAELNERGNPVVEPSQNPLPVEPEPELETITIAGGEAGAGEHGEHPSPGAVEGATPEPTKVH